MGASGTKRGAGNWEVTYRFGVRPNDAAFSVTGVPGSVAKRGWDYAWILAEKQSSASGITFDTTGAYIEEVYADGDFSTLGI